MLCYDATVVNVSHSTVNMITTAVVNATYSTAETIATVVNTTRTAVNYRR